jgi:hypothetical protein
MAPSPAVIPSLSRRGAALVGLTGAVLSGVGDVLILGRACSGREFDQATGRLPPRVGGDDRWRSLWNGAALPARRIRLGTLVGNLGIGLLQGPALLAISRALRPGREQRVAAASAAAFAVAGVLTHQCCGTVILAHQRATEPAAGATTDAPPAPSTAIRVLTASAAASLGALALLSASQTVAARRRGRTMPAWWWTVTPFPCVLATLLTFGALPAPVGGYARPASISIGLMVYFALTAASGARRPS